MDLVYINMSKELNTLESGLRVGVMAWERYLFPDKSAYEGELVNNMREGFGILQFPNDFLFVGYWKNDIQNGP